MEQKTLLEYWFVLYSRKWLILIIILSAMITAWVVSSLLPSVFEAKAVFFVPKEPDTTTFFTAPGGSMVRSPLAPLPSEDPQGPYIGVLKSKTIAGLVHKEFPQKRVEALLRKDMDFVLTNEYMIEVYARDKDPGLAAAIANAYVRYFNQLMGGYSLPPQSQTQVTIEEEISNNQKRLLEEMEALKAFQEKNRTANLDEEVRQLISQKTTFESQLERAQVEYNENNNRILATKKKLREEISIFKTSELVITSPLLEKLRSQLVDIEAKIATLGIEIKEPHPEYIALKKNYNEVKKNIDKEIERIINSQIKAPDTFYENLRRQLINLYVDKERIEAGIEATKAVLKGIDGKILEIPTLKNSLDTHVMEVERYRRLIDTLKVNLEEVKAQTRRNPQVAVMVEKAIPPPRPSFPILWLNVIVAGLSGLVGGVFYCFFANYLEETREGRIYRLWKAIESSEGEM